MLHRRLLGDGTGALPTRRKRPKSRDRAIAARGDRLGVFLQDQADLLQWAFGCELGQSVDAPGIGFPPVNAKQRQCCKRLGHGLAEF